MCHFRGQRTVHSIFQSERTKDTKANGQEKGVLFFAFYKSHPLSLLRVNLLEEKRVIFITISTLIFPPHRKRAKDGERELEWQKTPREYLGVEGQNVSEILLTISLVSLSTFFFLRHPPSALELFSPFLWANVREKSVEGKQHNWLQSKISHIQPFFRAGCLNVQLNKKVMVVCTLCEFPNIMGEARGDPRGIFGQEWVHKLRHP